MGIPAFVEMIGVPVYYIDTPVAEHVGDGVVRITNCQTRNGVLIPQCEVFIHSTRLLIAGRRVADFAESVLSRELLAGGGIRH